MWHCSNDAENSALHHRNKLHFKNVLQLKKLFKIEIIFHNITVFTAFFDQKNVALVSRRDFTTLNIKKKKKKILKPLNFRTFV